MINSKSLTAGPSTANRSPLKGASVIDASGNYADEVKAVDLLANGTQPQFNSKSNRRLVAMKLSPTANQRQIAKDQSVKHLTIEDMILSEDQLPEKNSPSTAE